MVYGPGIGFRWISHALGVRRRERDGQAAVAPVPVHVVHPVRRGRADAERAVSKPNQAAFKALGFL